MNFNAADPAQNGTVGRAGFDAFSPKVGLLFEPSAGVQFYANYSRSVEFPGFIELGQVAAFVPLDAQRAWTAEIGTRGKRGVLNRSEERRVGKECAVRVDLGGRRFVKKKQSRTRQSNTNVVGNN